MTENQEVIRVRAEALVDELSEFMSSLTSLRAEHNLSQGEIAQRMGISQSAVSQFEHYDANPTLNTIRRYALAVGARLRLRVVDDMREGTGAVAVRTIPLLEARTIAPQASVSWASSCQKVMSGV